MAYSKDALPVRMRETLKNELGNDVTLITKQGFRYDVQKAVNPDGDAPEAQLSEFHTKVLQVLGEMPEGFASVKAEVLDDVLNVRIKAVDYSPVSNGVSKGSKDAAIQAYIDSCFTKNSEYFGEEVAYQIGGILMLANDKRKEEEANKVIENMFAPQFGAKVANRMAELLKQVLAEEAANGIAPEDSNVLVDVAPDGTLAIEQDVPDSVNNIIKEAEDVANQVLTPNTNSRRNRSKQQQ